MSSIGRLVADAWKYKNYDLSTEEGRKRMTDTEQAHTAVCVNCDTDREPHTFYYTRNCELAVAVCEPCAGEYTYDVCVNCHKQAEITDLTEGPTYKHFDGVPTYFPHCGPCETEGAEAVEREVREHIEGTRKTITHEEFQQMSKPNPPVRVIQDFHATTPYPVRVTMRDGQGTFFNRFVAQVVGYAPNPDVGHLEAQVLVEGGMLMSLGDVVEETATRTGHEDSGYRFGVEVIANK